MVWSLIHDWFRSSLKLKLLSKSPIYYHNIIEVKMMAQHVVLFMYVVVCIPCTNTYCGITAFSKGKNAWHYYSIQTFLASCTLVTLQFISFIFCRYCIGSSSTSYYYNNNSPSCEEEEEQDMLFTELWFWKCKLSHTFEKWYRSTCMSTCRQWQDRLVCKMCVINCYPRLYTV